tara:strand:+ start:18145 stop:19638 length:1494 start_codon:yes stop_codon:yes gene_type:complete
MTKILDCTIRDGGYYNNWDFTDEIFNKYIEATNNLPIHYIEIGYISKPSSKYKGKYFYLNKKTVSYIKSISSKNLSAMIDIKNIDNIDELEMMVLDFKNKIKMIRLASSIENIDKSIEAAKILKKYNFEVAINLMRVSKIDFNHNLLIKLKEINKVVDILYLVDSYGSLTTDKLKKDISLLKEKTNLKIGFHGHNNLELAFSNTIESIKMEIEIVDATVTGMGRGAGNLKLELLLVYLSSIEDQNNLFLNSLSSIVSEFNKLKKEYNWGTSLPYMISGAFSQPQQEVMDLIRLNRYTFDSIVNNITNTSSVKYSKFKHNKKYNEVFIIGGGQSVNLNIDSIVSLLKKRKCLIFFCTSKYLESFNNIDNDKFFAVSGDETSKFDFSVKIKKFITSPHPRKINPIQNDKIELEELNKITFINNHHDSALAIALQSIIDMKINDVYMIGFDGYLLNSSKNSILNLETQEVINAFNQTNKITSLTQTNYEFLIQRSIHEFK